MASDHCRQTFLDSADHLHSAKHIHDMNARVQRHLVVSCIVGKHVQRFVMGKISFCDVEMSVKILCIAKVLVIEPTFVLNVGHLIFSYMLNG